MPATVSREQSQIGGAVVVLVENGLSAIAALGHMMPAAGYDHPGDSSHEQIYSQLRVLILSPLFEVE
jgi:hypothetical protein